MAEYPPVGTPVFVWGRPAHDLILLFGEGTYEGLNYINTMNCPIVRLTDGREWTIHYPGVWVGERANVKAQCEKFKGDVIEWDLQAYLRNELPSRERRAESAVASGRAPTVEAPPKTVTDKLLHLKREIDVEQSKIKVYEAAIETSRKLIESKRADAAAIKDLVLAELSSLDDVPPEAILAAAERIKAQQASVKPTVEPEASIEPTTRDEFHKLATED